ncbi:hypothetical protein [Bifidobacterium crudilactis]|jgi:hypothetical protein|uniref:hypothetical protein n=1 Tax=Bifidobacterium crudilactis TaxID=327277 RepID=UPI00235210EE|nr:hypothetical protein [Bifidobacterium crudilactis]MCI1218483.1 hypothetical protein [Bifidobacterium crudilactis]
MNIQQVSDEHLNVMVHALRTYTPDGTVWLTRHAPSPPVKLDLDHDSDLDRIGQILRDENTHAVNQRHNKDDVVFHQHHPPRHDDWTPVQVLKATLAYQSQACTSTRWECSDAKQLCEQLLYAAIRRLDGYAQAPWMITETTLPTPEA